MDEEASQAWYEDAIVPMDDAFAPGEGCYTTGRWTGREIRWSAAVVGRLARDSAAMGYGRPDPLGCAIGMHALGEATFGAREGIVRFEARPGTGARPRIIGTARELGNHPATARAAPTRVIHPGPHRPAPGAKIPRPEIDAAREERDSRSLDEVLIFDAEGFLVEGSRCNVLVALADGSWAAPPPSRGGVFGVGLELCLDRVPEIVERDLRSSDLESASEILLTNGARGAFPIHELEGRAAPPTISGPFLARLTSALAD